MTCEEAVDLIKVPAINADPVPRQWADLGAGSGLFSSALLRLLPPGSTVYAVDRREQTSASPGIKFIRADFEKDALSLPPLDGIIMANSLHYVKNKLPLLLQLRDYLKTAGIIVLVEYEKRRSNPWVPYPLRFSLAEELFGEAGFTTLRRIAERPSIYSAGAMYSAWCRRSDKLASPFSSDQ